MIIVFTFAAFIGYLLTLTVCYGLICYLFKMDEMLMRGMQTVAGYLRYYLYPVPGQVSIGLPVISLHILHGMTGIHIPVQLFPPRQLPVRRATVCWPGKLAYTRSLRVHALHIFIILIKREFFHFFLLLWHHVIYSNT